MATPSVGQDIDALCGKCGQVWHVVMAKMGERIAKVVCKRCGGLHRYRSEDTVEAAAMARDGKRSSAGSGTPRPRVTSATAPALPAFDPDKPPRRYAPAEAYAAGDRVSHPSFGVGIVAGSPGAGKVEVVFPGGVRVLACAKTTSTLTRPIMTANVPISDRPPK
jgi:hypothetical protein